MNPEIKEAIEELMPIATKFVQTQTARLNAKQVNKLAIIDLTLFDHTLNKSCNSCIKTCLTKLYNYQIQRQNIKASITKVTPKVNKQEETNLEDLTFTELKVIAKNKGLDTKGKRSKKAILELLTK